MFGVPEHTLYPFLTGLFPPCSSPTAALPAPDSSLTSAAPIMTEVDPTILRVYGPVPAGLDIDADPRPANTAAIGALLLVATIAMVARLVCRRMTNTGLKADDYSIMAALFFTYACGGVSISTARYGAGRHTWALTAKDLSIAGQVSHTQPRTFFCLFPRTKRVQLRKRTNKGSHKATPSS